MLSLIQFILAGTIISCAALLPCAIQDWRSRNVNGYFIALYGAVCLAIYLVETYLIANFAHANPLALQFSGQYAQYMILPFVVATIFVGVILLLKKRFQFVDGIALLCGAIGTPIIAGLSLIVYICFLALASLMQKDTNIPFLTVFLFLQVGMCVLLIVGLLILVPHVQIL